MTDRQRVREAEIEQLWRYQKAVERLHAAEARQKLVKHYPVHTDTKGLVKHYPVHTNTTAMKKIKGPLLTFKKR